MSYDLEISAETDTETPRPQMGREYKGDPNLLKPGIPTKWVCLPLDFITEPLFPAGIEVSRAGEGDAFLVLVVLDKKKGNNFFLLSAFLSHDD
jgi:hypothetical protein